MSLDVNFDIIVLSEIWNCNLDLCKQLFDGYTFYFDIPVGSIVGGVGVYVRNCFFCNLLENFKLASTEKNKIENIWMEIISSKHKFILGAIYRHPNQHVNEFSTLLDKNLCQIANSRDPCNCW